MVERARSSGMVPSGNGFREVGVALAWSALILAPILGLGGRAVYGTWWARESALRAEAEAALAYERLVEADALPVVDAAAAAHGREVYYSACVTCHGADGRGMKGLGRSLVESDFAAGMDDASLAGFLEVGRPNVKPIGMPPKGGREELTGEDLRAVVAYMRGLQDPRRMPALPEMVVAAATPSDAEKAKALAAAGGDEELAGYIASGSALFARSCVACHGAGGVGVKGNGKPLVNNGFVRGLDDDGMLAFLKRGRDPSDPANTTGVGMPAKGGNPALDEDDLLDIIAYLRTLAGDGGGTGASASGGPR
ncbi:MAG: c-type cytochrome [Phycisphaeraceae bacterium]|nr:MAG: c-type cytochrome [Phycisphaeraceae bacterium]